MSDTSVFNTFSKAWDLAFSDFWPFFAVILLVGIIDFVSSVFSSGNNFHIGLFVISMVLGFFISRPIKMSSDWVFLKAARKDDYEILDMFSVFKRNYWNAVGASFLSLLFVGLGLILLIIPGIIIGIRLVFVPYLVIDKKLGAMAAIKASWEMSRGYSWKIFGMSLLSILIAIAGILVLIVGVLVSAVWISSAFAVLYNSISLKRDKVGIAKK